MSCHSKKKIKSLSVKDNFKNFIGEMTWYFGFALKHSNNSPNNGWGWWERLAKCW